MTTKQVPMREIREGDTISRGGRTFVVNHVERYWNALKVYTTLVLSETISLDSNTLILKVQDDGNRTKS